MAKRKRLKLLSKRYDPKFVQFLKEHVTVDPSTGLLSAKNCYAYLGFNVNWNGDLYSATYANVVWLLSHGRWPEPGMHIDHINDDPLDNRPSNLQEITPEENHAKRRGRMVYRSYGKGKYGYGINIHYDKRDDRHYVVRHMSRGHGLGNGVRYGIGGFDTREEALAAVEAHKKLLDEKGENYFPPKPKRVKVKKVTLELDRLFPKMQELRKQGKTYQAIADELGVKMGVVYRRLNE